MDYGLNMYNAQADTIDVDGIATSSNNRIVLRRLKRNDANDDYNESLYIQHQHDDDGERCRDYVPEGIDDMGWSGYFIGKSDHLQKLFIYPYMGIEAEESQLEEEEELQEEFMQRKQLLHQRKESIMKKLGGKLQNKASQSKMVK